MDVKQIQKVLPHRYPMLLVDRIEELEIGKRVRGYKNVTANESFFQGHYPSMPIMPGVLIVESMAQVAAVMLMADPDFEGKTPLVIGLDKVKFRRPVVPGDCLVTEATLMWFRRSLGTLRAVGTVNGELAAEAEISFKLLNNGETV